MLRRYGFPGFRGEVHYVARFRDAVKLLYWERNGFCLWHKKLEQERFRWPTDRDGAIITLTGQQLNWLLDGYDIRRLRPHKALSYKTLL